MAERMRYVPHKVLRDDRPDGTILLKSGHDMSPVVDTSAVWLHRWAAETPGAVFLAERSGAGWRTITYGEALEKVRALAAALLDRGMGPDTPILIISGNGVDHGLLTLAAQYVGIPTVPVAEQYSLVPGAQKQLEFIIGLIDPRMVYAVDAERFGASLGMNEMAGRDLLVSTGARPGQIAFDDLLKGGSSDVDAALRRVGPDTVAKILMTSGSTSDPKGVITTHRMMCANQTQNADAMPFLKSGPVRIVDWLPWNHVFGGCNNFNLVLANGGSLYIDDGKPIKGLIDRTIENNLLMNGTIAYNVPIGFAMLRDEMRANTKLREAFFKDLRMVFYAGASLPQDVWDDLTEMARDVRGDVPLMTTCWGLTETAPACIFQHQPSSETGILGVPMTGLQVKLVPDQGARYEVRVKGPNVTPGYYKAPDRTAAAFDDEGFFKSGDAMTFVDPRDSAKGLRFDGRMSEDFKLATGTWVRAAALRLDALAALAPLASDVVVTGDGLHEVGLLIVPSAHLVATGDLVRDGTVFRAGAQRDEIKNRLTALAERTAGQSNRVARALIMSEPPSMADGEITAKGNLNFRKLLARRHDVLERLYSTDDAAVILL